MTVRRPKGALVNADMGGNPGIRNSECRQLFKADPSTMSIHRFYLVLSSSCPRIKMGLVMYTYTSSSSLVCVCPRVCVISAHLSTALHGSAGCDTCDVSGVLCLRMTSRACLKCLFSNSAYFPQSGYTFLVTDFCKLYFGSDSH